MALMNFILSYNNSLLFSLTSPHQNKNKNKKQIYKQKQKKPKYSCFYNHPPLSLSLSPSPSLSPVLVLSLKNHSIKDISHFFNSLVICHLSHRSYTESFNYFCQVSFFFIRYVGFFHFLVLCEWQQSLDGFGTFDLDQFSTFNGLSIRFE